MTHLRIAVAGSRTITDYNQFIVALTEAIKYGVVTPANTFEIVSGGAKGVDTLARRYATEFNYKLTELKPQYRGNYDRGAPLRRNLDIAASSDVLVAVWDGVSTGTKHMIAEMKKLNKPTYVHIVK